MKEQELDNLYEICKNISPDDFSELLEKAKSPEEQKFYSVFFDFFLQQRQKKVIKQGLF